VKGALRSRRLYDVKELVQRLLLSLGKDHDMKIQWERPPTPRTVITKGWIADRHVATIVRTRNHTARIKRVYSVDVLGEELSRMYESIGDARTAAEAEFLRHHRDFIPGS
jgi:hypothetical protein